MGNLFSALSVAQSGLQSAQVQLNVAGHNIANVNTEGYSRQKATLTTRAATTESYGELGRGVDVSDVARVREDFLDTVYRQQLQGLGSTEVRAAYFAQIEDLFQEPSESGFGTQISSFFDALSDFADNVEEQAVRTSVITQAETLASSLNQLSEQLYALRTNANEEVKNYVPEINTLAQSIASLNKSISQSEVTGHSANDLRDERDVLLDQLSKLVGVSYRERDDGQVDIFISGDILVSGDASRELVAQMDSTVDPERSDVVTVRFADNGTAADIRGGEIYGALMARDTDLAEASASLDEIAAAIIEQINKIQSTGNGLDALSGTISGTNAVDDPANALSAAGLPFDVAAGSFDVVVYDASGTATTTTITITDSTTLDDLVTSLNTISNFSASVGSDNTLGLGATGTYTFSFQNDTSNALTALGVNGLFTGYDASTIAVSGSIQENSSLLTSGYSTDVLNTGDNTAAIALADVRNALVFDNGTATIQNFYESMIVRVGVNSEANSTTLDVQQAFVDDYATRRQQVSGVSTDEEVTSLLLYERAYQSAARVITIADRMLDTLMGMAL